jgi:hypothetical protein
MAITKATVPSETSFVCNTKLFLEGSNNANLAKVLIRGARQLASGMSGIDGIDSIRQYLNNCDIEALITRIEESKNSLLRFDDSFAGEYFELLRQSINKLDENSSNGQYLREYGIYEKDYWNTLVAMLEKNEDNLNETLKEQLAIARAMAGYYNTSDEMGSRNTDSEKMVDLLEERKKCEAELLRLNKGLTEEDLAKALDSLEERYAVTILGVKYNSVQEKMSELNIDDEDYEDKCIDLLKEGTRYQKELLGLSKYLTKEEIKEQSALLDEECEKNVILVKNSIAGNQLSKLDITDEDYTIKCITLLAKQKEYAKEILKLDKSLTSEQLDEKINALESQYQYSCLLAENGKFQNDLNNLNIEAKDYEEKRLELLKGQRNCIEQMLKMNNNLTEEQISEQLTLLDQEIHSAEQNVEWNNTDFGCKFWQYFDASLLSFESGLVDIGENIYDGLAMLFSTDKEKTAELVKADVSEELYAQWVKERGVNDNAAYSKVHDVGNAIGTIGGTALIIYATAGIGAPASAGAGAGATTLGGSGAAAKFAQLTAGSIIALDAGGSASERALNSGATFDQAYWLGINSAAMGYATGVWTSGYTASLNDKVYSSLWEVGLDALKSGGMAVFEPTCNSILEYSIYANDLKDANGNLLYEDFGDYYIESGAPLRTVVGFSSAFLPAAVRGYQSYYSDIIKNYRLLAKEISNENIEPRENTIQDVENIYRTDFNDVTQYNEYLDSLTPEQRTAFMTEYYKDGGIFTTQEYTDYFKRTYLPDVSDAKFYRYSEAYLNPQFYDLENKTFHWPNAEGAIQYAHLSDEEFLSLANTVGIDGLKALGAEEVTFEELKKSGLTRATWKPDISTDQYGEYFGGPSKEGNNDVHHRVLGPDTTYAITDGNGTIYDVAISEPTRTTILHDVAGFEELRVGPGTDYQVKILKTQTANWFGQQGGADQYAFYLTDKNGKILIKELNGMPPQAYKLTRKDLVGMGIITEIIG